MLSTCPESRLSKEIIHDFRHTPPSKQPITIDDKAVEKVKTYKYLGCIIQEDLKWDNHITSQMKKCNKRLFHPEAIK